MEAIEKRIYYLDLFHIYQELLSPSQKEVLTDYLEYDLSLSEIAENKSVSRAAIEDAIKKGMKKLDEFEKKLSIYYKNTVILENTALLREKLGNIKEINDIEEALK